MHYCAAFQDTESLKDWKACRQHQPEGAAAATIPPEPSAAQLRRLISAEQLSHSLAELERSASRALGQPPAPPPSATAALSSSQLVEQVHKLERSLTDLTPATPLPPLQPWVAVRRAERVTGPVAPWAAGVTGVTQSPRVPNSAASGATGGSVSALSPAKPTEAAGDFWVTSDQPQVVEITQTAPQVAPYVTINNQKIPITISQYSVQARQKVQDTIASQVQDPSGQKEISDSSNDRGESEAVPPKSEIERNKTKQKKRPVGVTNPPPAVGEAVPKPAAVDSNQRQTDTTNTGQQSLLAASNAGGSTKNKTMHKASNKVDNHAASNNVGTKVGSEPNGSIRTAKTNEKQSNQSPRGVANTETKTKKRKPVKASNVDIQRENHSDTEIETTERKNKLETGSQDKRTSYSDNTQPVKILLQEETNQPKD